VVSDPFAVDTKNSSGGGVLLLLLLPPPLLPLVVGMGGIRTVPLQALTTNAVDSRGIKAAARPSPSKVLPKSRACGVEWHDVSRRTVV
jgi:hypothetical protein